jgi:hypothetical protein
MKIPKTSSRTRSVVVSVAFVAATAIVTVLGMAAVVPASSIVKPAYAQISSDIGEEIIEGEIPDLLEDIVQEQLPRLDFGEPVQELIFDPVEEFGLAEITG